MNVSDHPSVLLALGAGLLTGLSPWNHGVLGYRPIPEHFAWTLPKIFTDAGSVEDRNTILALLGKVPAYRLLYDDDPSIAARFFRSVLDAHQLMEQRT